MPSGCTNNFPESGRGLGHVTTTIFGRVRSAILATAWLLVLKKTMTSVRQTDRRMGRRRLPSYGPPSSLCRAALLIVV